MTSKGIHPNTTSLQPLNSSDIEATNLHEQNEELNQQKGPGKSRAVLIEDHNFPETKRSYLITVRYSCVCVCVVCVLSSGLGHTQRSEVCLPPPITSEAHHT